MNGILVINKQRGMTSHDVVARARKLLKTRKIGHTGTLDPEASGVLVLCVGKATRLSRFLMAARKEYMAEMVLGVRTDTQDHAGRIISQTPCPDLDRARAEAVLQGFSGEISQVPPMVSAVRHRGRKLYELARKGSEVPREPRKVTIYRIKLLDCSPPRLRFEVECSKGTYIRTLCSDIGDALGCGAHQSELTRTRSGPFSIEDALLLEELEKLKKPEERIIPPDSALSYLPGVTVKGWVEKFIAKNMRVSERDVYQNPDLEPGELARILSPNRVLLAIGKTLPRTGADSPIIEILHRL